MENNFQSLICISGVLVLGILYLSVYANTLYCKYDDEVVESNRLMAKLKDTLDKLKEYVQ